MTNLMLFAKLRVLGLSIPFQITSILPFDLFTVIKPKLTLLSMFKIKMKLKTSRHSVSIIKMTGIKLASKNGTTNFFISLVSTNRMLLNQIQCLIEETRIERDQLFT